jgi:uncharacterized damage-inducible protein DinB
MMKTTILILALSTFAFGADTTVAKLYDSQLSGVENEIVPLVKEMPEAAFSFAPKQGAFSNARTFAQQAKHVAAVNYMVAAAALGEKPPIDLGSGENGPDTVKTKEQIVKFLTDSYAYAHKAMNSLTPKNQVEMIKAPFQGAPDMARGAIANIAITHSFDHYGQMVVYARMNNLVPPASR